LTNQALLWTGFAVTIGIMFTLDLGVFNRKTHAITFREASAWKAVWVSRALPFNAGVYI